MGCGTELTTEVPCNGSVVVVTTCCDEYPTATECVRAHMEAVRRVQEACGAQGQ